MPSPPLAGLATEKPSAQVRNFPALIKDTRRLAARIGHQRRHRSRRDDAPGVTALLAVSARGQDPTAAALALWREYHHARAALLALVPEQETIGPLREA